jgi:hypothetical protein
MKYAKKNIGVPSTFFFKNIPSSQPRKLIFGIQPYLTQLDEIYKNNTNWGTVKKKTKYRGAIQKKIKQKSLPVNLGS